jgi:hypothetical protein
MEDVFTGTRGCSLSAFRPVAPLVHMFFERIPMRSLLLLTLALRTGMATFQVRK